jgi:hypothetical protein
MRWLFSAGLRGYALRHPGKGQAAALPVKGSTTSTSKPRSDTSREDEQQTISSLA